MNVFLQRSIVVQPRTPGLHKLEEISSCRRWQWLEDGNKGMYVAGGAGAAEIRQVSGAGRFASSSAINVVLHFSILTSW